MSEKDATIAAITLLSATIILAFIALPPQLSISLMHAFLSENFSIKYNLIRILFAFLPQSLFDRLKYFIGNLIVYFTIIFSHMMAYAMARKFPSVSKVILLLAPAMLVGVNCINLIFAFMLTLTPFSPVNPIQFASYTLLEGTALMLLAFVGFSAYTRKSPWIRYKIKMVYRPAWIPIHVAIIILLAVANVLEYWTLTLLAYNI